MARTHTPDDFTAFVTPSFFEDGGKQARMHHAITAVEELKKEQARGNLEAAVVSVDRRQKKRIENVRFGGHIEFADAGGDVFDLAMEAIELAIRIAPYLTGHYERSFKMTVANSRGGSVPFNRANVNPDSIVEIRNTADYASALENAFLPNGILYFVYNTLRRKYGRRFSYQFDYVKRTGEFTTPRLRLAGPAKIFTSATRPGTSQRRSSKRGR